MTESNSAILALPGIYKLECTANGKVYIGKSKNVKRRIQEHLSKLRKNKHHNRHLQYTYNKYGEDYFTVDILEYIDLNHLQNIALQLGIRETYFYNFYPKEQLMNLEIPLPEGNAVSEETKERISKGSIDCGRAKKRFMINLTTQTVEKVFDRISEAIKYLRTIGIKDGTAVSSDIISNPTTKRYGYGWLGEDGVYQDENGTYYIKELYVWDFLKPIAKFDNSGKFIEAYESIRHAAETNNSSERTILRSISLNDKRNKYYWRNIDPKVYIEYTLNKNIIEDIPIVEIVYKKIFQYDLFTGDILNIFLTTKEAVEATGNGSISHIAKSNRSAFGIGYCFEDNIVIDEHGKHSIKNVFSQTKQIGKFSIKNELIEVYYSAKIASEENNIHGRTLYEQIKNNVIKNDCYYKYIDFDTFRNFNQATSIKESQ